LSVTTLPRETSAAPVVKPAGRELELKFLVSEPAFRASQNWPMLAQAAPRRAMRLRSFYYDTPSGALHRHNMALRMRAQRRGFLLTLKYEGGFPGGPFERGEVEVFSQNAVPEPGLLGEEFAAAVASAAGGEKLVLAYETDIRRITHRLSTPTGEIELAFDSGHILADGAKMPVREIELELKSGEPAELFRVGIELARNFPVRLGTLAKSERGFLLRTGTPPAVVRASPALAGSPSVDEAISALLGACVKQFLANFAAFEEGDSQYAIHQMRVALRRLRALLGLFGKAFPCPELSAFRHEAKMLAGAMNGARDIDVFLDLLRDGPCRVFADVAGFAGMMGECAARRRAEYDKIKILLAAPETTAFVLSLQSALARRVWRNGLDAAALARLVAPARDLAGQQISRMHQKILKRGGKHLRLSAHDRHELRIGVKKLRYTTESFSGLFEARKQVRGYLRSAAGLQDALGGFNDLVMAQRIVDTLPDPDGRAAGIVLGWCARGAVLDAALLESWRDFRRANNPFG